MLLIGFFIRFAAGEAEPAKPGYLLCAGFEIAPRVASTLALGPALQGDVTIGAALDGSPDIEKC